MTTATLLEQKTTDPVVRRSGHFLLDLLRDYGPREFAVRFWEGTVIPADGGREPRFTLVLQHPGSVRRMFWPPDQSTLGEAYIYNDYDIEGDLEGFWNIIDFLRQQKRGLLTRLKLARQLLSLPKQEQPRVGRLAAHLHGRRHSLERDREAIRYHYDVPSDFYKLWLDGRLVYSCAYFRRADDDLDTAQENKLDYVCRKLRLAPGQRLLDIGCGYGGLVLHAAQRYGVEALGITLSQRQYEVAQERIRAAGLEGRCRVELRDYREIHEPGRYDRLASIGMVEHVGGTVLPTYFQQAWNLLRPGGVFLNHGISLHGQKSMPKKPTFAMRYVFPDGELRPVSATLAVAEKVGFEVRDVESLREHYEKTLRHWAQRLEQHLEEARRITDDVTCRVWRLYLSGSADTFRRGYTNIHQCLLVKPDGGKSGLPLTREDWYG